MNNYNPTLSRILLGFAIAQANLPYNDFSGLTEQYWIYIGLLSRYIQILIFGVKW
ncbi:hypothetical protein IQ226_18565 [Dolichospermum sp. LEGE 00240]|uniref:hypothetical protein n=1 Tax=Dolichospermum sp. LEGE 00240 TaxID=1828603 RepID=UPI001881882E|nr:hypothetical protein [Dolichospermum sp. LEGE 00240]MBE9251096.1 hypothetical protein [Dolichospermum sp. LEGE 00240]MDM3851068.1 hypothetical protein [Aphanizomenon gracile PMC627.10]